MVKEFKEEFAEYKCTQCSCECPSIRECDCECECFSIWANTAAKPEPMTTEEARASGERCGQKIRELQRYRDAKEKPPRGLVTEVKNTEEEESFKDVCAILKLHEAEGWDLISRIACDPSHEFYNLVKDFLALIGNYGNMELKPKYLSKEQERGRFPGVTRTKKKQKTNTETEPDSEEVNGVPFHVSKKLKSILTQLVRDLRHKIPYGWPALMDYFTDEYEKIKMAEALLFCGNVGSYLIQLTDIQDKVKVVFIELLSVSSLVINKSSTDELLQDCYMKLVVVLAKLEILLPLYWNTGTRHFLLHTFDFIKRLGRFWSFSMMGVERIHIMIKKLGKSKRNVMASLQKNNDLNCMAQLQWRFNPDHKWTNKGKVSSLHLKPPVPLDDGVVMPQGGMRKRKASTRIFKALEDEWAIRDKNFDRLRDRHRRYVRTHRRQGHRTAPPLEFSQWQLGQNLSGEAKRLL